MFEILQLKWAHRHLLQPTLPEIFQDQISGLCQASPIWENKEGLLKVMLYLCNVLEGKKVTKQSVRDWDYYK